MIDVAALRRARLDLAYARTVALLAAGAKRRRHREAFATDLRALLLKIDLQLEAIEQEGWRE